MRRAWRRKAVGVLTCLLCLTACSGSGDEPSGPQITGPRNCPRGFALALASHLSDVHAVAELEPRDIGFAKIANKIACVVRTDSHTTGASAVVVLRAGLSEETVRGALWDLAFDDGAHSIMSRDGVGRGEATTLVLLRYGGVTRDWGPKRWRLREAFPPDTVVLDASLRVPHIQKRCKDAAYDEQFSRARSPKALSAPAARIVSCRPKTAKEMGRDFREMLQIWTPEGAHCQDVTSIDYDWQNDMRCTRPDGSQFYTDYEGAAAFLGYDSAAEMGR